VATPPQLCVRADRRRLRKVLGKVVAVIRSVS
jgi:hypothetical protein